MGVAKGNLTYEAQINLQTSNGYLVLHGAEEKISVLRGVRIFLKANLDYEVEAMMSDWHYDVRKLISANGILALKITAVPRGYTKDENEIIGEYTAQLTQNNAPFKLHCFVEPDGELRKNHSLNWNINTIEPLKFL